MKEYDVFLKRHVTEATLFIQSLPYRSDIRLGKSAIEISIQHEGDAPLVIFFGAENEMCVGECEIVSTAKSSFESCAEIEVLSEPPALVENIYNSIEACVGSCAGVDSIQKGIPTEVQNDVLVNGNVFAGLQRSRLLCEVDQFQFMNIDDSTLQGLDYIIMEE